MKWGSQAAICLILLVTTACSDDDPAGPHPPTKPQSRSVSSDGSGRYKTIQAAINASASGDTILLENGRYDGAGNVNIDFGGRDLVLTSKSGDPENCIIGYDSLSDIAFRGFHFHNGETAAAIVQDIKIVNGSPEYGGGGAVLCESASPIFRNVIFFNHKVNAVTSGGGSPTFVDCVFWQNNDGALSCSGGSPHITRCVFQWNYAEGAGAGLSVLYSNAIVQDCVFLGNGAGFGGGAIQSWATGESGPSQLTVERCLFQQNMAGYHGGAVMSMETVLDFVDCVFVDNACGIMGGAIDCSYRSQGRISNCVFYGSQGTEGAALNCEGDSLLVIENSIIMASSGSTAVECGQDVKFKPSFSCSDVYGNTSGDWADCIAEQDSLNNNISIDPMFCDPKNGDFRLQATSPLLNLDCRPLESWSTGCGTPLDKTNTWRELIARAKLIKDRRQ